MKLILILGICLVIQIIDSKLYLVQPIEEVYPYLIDKTVTPFTDYLIDEHFIIEQIDDQQVMVSGYVQCKKSLDPNLPMQFNLRTQYLDKSSWVEGPLVLIIPNICTEFLNPSRFWYNITKLWTACPPKLGDKWPTESHIIDMEINLPPSFPKGQWRSHILIYQGLFAKVPTFGLTAEVELIDID